MVEVSRYSGNGQSKIRDTWQLSGEATVRLSCLNLDLFYRTSIVLGQRKVGVIIESEFSSRP